MITTYGTARTVLRSSTIGNERQYSDYLYQDGADHREDQEKEKEEKEEEKRGGQHGEYRTWRRRST